MALTVDGVEPMVIQREGRWSSDEFMVCESPYGRVTAGVNADMGESYETR